MWDQAERDVKCPVSVAAYACMQRLLASSWRTNFHSPRAPFVAVQLPGYTAALNNGTGNYNGSVTAEMVFAMRLQQEAGTAGLDNASFVATYDQSCALPAPACPFGSVHNVQKDVVGARVGATLHNLLVGGDEVVEGPRATKASLVTTSATGSIASLMGGGRGHWKVAVEFSGGTAPFHTAGTKNCTSCCDATKDAHTLDFVATCDGGASWVNGTVTGQVATASTSNSPASTLVTFDVPLATAPTAVRYTAGAIFPQCALYNAEGLPAIPFEMAVTA